MPYRIRPFRVEALKLLDSATASEQEWDDHVEEVHEFFGGVEWFGDDCGIHVEGNPAFIGHPGDWIVKLEGKILGVFSQEEFERYYEPLSSGAA